MLLAMIFTLLMLLTVTSALPSPQYSDDSERSYAIFTRCHAGTNQHGESHEFHQSVGNLANLNFDNTIESIYQTGMWIYYDNPDYNIGHPGKVFWAHGIDFYGNVPYEYVNTATSLRSAGSSYNLNEDSWTVYSGTTFTGHDSFGTEDMPSLGDLNNEISSIIITGKSPWTFYDMQQYSGYHVCLYPDTHHDNAHYQHFDIGLFPDLSSLDMGDNAFESVRKGCWSGPVFKGNQVQTLYNDTNGAWGYFEP